MCQKIVGVLSKLLTDRRASVAPMLALLSLPLLGSLGAAVDYSRANSARAAMQGALDATALMLGKQSPNPDLAKAQSYFEGIFTRPEVQSIEITSAAQPGMNGTSISMTATGSVKTPFLKAMGFSSLNLFVQSAVTAEADGLGCVLSLNNTVSAAVSSQGSSATNLDTCALYDNSSNASALTNGGSARISALFVGVVGGVSSPDGITATQGIKTGIGRVADPYADVSFPTFSGCKEHNYTAKTVETITPGVYCGGIGVNANAVLTLTSGIYYLDGGNFSVNGGASVQGQGVTLVFTKKSERDYATASINGDANINLTAMTSGPTAGIVIFGDRNIPVGTTFKFNGGSSQYLGGAIYVPTGAITFSGGNTTGTSCTQLIGDTVTFVGNSKVKIDCSHYETKPFSAKILRLTS